MSEFSRPLQADIHLDLETDARSRGKQSTPPLWRNTPHVRWSIYLLIAAFCLYRIAIFRPLPLDDTTGALRPLLYGWFSRYVALFHDPGQAFLAWSHLCICGLIFATVLALINYLLRENVVRLPNFLGRLLSSSILFWTSLALTVFVCRFPALIRGELNPDESLFLTAAGKLFYDPNFFRSVITGTSGPVNIYPLMWPAIFGLSPDFASSRLLGVMCVLLSVFTLYRALILIGSERLARVAVLPVAGAFALFRHGELVHNSSEHIPLLLVSVALYQGVKLIVESNRRNPPSFFWLGFIASSAYLAKMQALPIIAGIGAVAFAYRLLTGYTRRVWDSAGWGLVGALIPIDCIVALSVEGGAFRWLWREYVRANVAYASATNPSETLRSFSEYVVLLPEVRIFLLTVFAIVIAHLILKMRSSMSPANTLLIEILAVSTAVSASAFLPSTERSTIYAYVAILLISAAPLYFLLIFRDRSSREDPVKWFGLMAVVSVGAAVFSVYKPHRYFAHYLLFLYIPVGAVVGYLLIREGGTEEGSPEAGTTRKRRWLRLVERRLAFACAVPILSMAGFVLLWDFQTPADLDVPPIIRAPEGYLIRYLTAREDQIFVWGWDLNPFLSSGRVPSSRATTTAGLFQSNIGILPPRFVPTPESERASAMYQAQQLRELEANPPALFIDAVGPVSWFLKEREFWGFELIPSIKAFVEQRYVHLTDLYAERFYLRRDIAAKREAEFSRPMPELHCSPSAIRCSERAITLPTDLPATSIPAHARIEVEFMPIHDQLGPATVFNSEKVAESFRGLRLRRVKDDRYSLLIGFGDGWANSKEFSAPANKAAFISIEVNGTTVTLNRNGATLDEVHLPRPFADAGGPINIDSWIGGVDPFSGKVQFFQIVDLDKKQSRSASGKARSTIR